MNNHKLTIYTDGGKNGRYAFKAGDKVHIGHEPKADQSTIEILAILRALQYAVKVGSIYVTIYSDFKPCVKQLSHRASINNNSIRLIAYEIWALQANLSVKGGYVKFMFVPRKKNPAGLILGS